MKKFRLIIGAIVLALMTLITTLPSQAAPPRTVILPQIEQSVLQDRAIELPTIQNASGALMFRNINDLNPATNFRETIDRITNERRFRTKPFAEQRGFRLKFKQPSNSVFANRKNKSSPFNQ